MAREDEETSIGRHVRPQDTGLPHAFSIGGGEHRDEREVALRVGFVALIHIEVVRFFLGLFVTLVFFFARQLPLRHEVHV